jgi:hypothetical protein
MLHAGSAVTYGCPRTTRTAHATLCGGWLRIVLPKAQRLRNRPCNIMWRLVGYALCLQTLAGGWRYMDTIMPMQLVVA